MIRTATYASEFVFKSHKPADGERRTHGLVDVYDRASGAHLGMLNPVYGGGYVLRDRNGVRLGASNMGRIEDMAYVSRPTAASLLRTRIRELDAIAERRAGSVSDGCPNNWHNSGSYRETHPCPECPSQPGLKFAVQLLENTGGWVDADVLARLHGEIYRADDAS